MAIFEYKALDASGKTIRGMIEADTVKTARSKLKKNGLILNDIHEKSVSAKSGSGKVSAAGGIFNRVKLADVALTTRQLASLIKANIPIVEALTALIDQVDAGALDDAELPRDVLTTLLLHDGELHLPPEVVRREIAFFLLAGAHTSATAFVRTLHHVFAMADDRPEEQIERRLAGQDVRAALGRLPQAQREAIELAYYVGMSQAQIAARVGTPIGTVKTRLRLGLLHLRRALAEAEGPAL